MIAEFISRQAIGALWNLVWHFGLVGIVMFAALAAAYFTPAWLPASRKTALTVAAGAFLVLMTAGYYTNKGANYVQAKWNAAIEYDARHAGEAREEAEAAVPAAGDGDAVERLPNDKWDRDNRK